MNRLLRILTIALVPLALAMASCSGEPSSVADAPDYPGTAVLMIHTGIIEGGRSGENGQYIDSREKLHSLRTVILNQSESGTDYDVEVNDFVEFGAEPLVSLYRIFELTKGKKLVYFIANEKSVDGLTARLEAFDKAEMDGFSYDVQSIGDKPIPATAVYDIELTEDDRGKRIEKEWYLVRAATKFAFRFWNYRTSPVRVNSIDISSTSGSMYLLPHVNEPDLTKQFKDKDNNLIKLHWIEWLRRVAEESQNNLPFFDNYDPDQAEGRGWITAYDLPDGATHTQRTIELTNFNLPANMPARDDKEEAESKRTPIVTEEYYYNESKFGADGNGEQHYTMGFNLTENEKSIKFSDIKFPVLKALFRNTHVIVDVEIGPEIIVRVIPYAEKWLFPIFGLGPDPVIPYPKQSE